jgi:type I restriction enzyme S subunit
MSFKQFEYDNYPTAPVNRGAILLSGYAFKSQDFCGMGIPVIKIKNIQNAQVTCADSQYVSKDLITKKLEKYLLKNGDVLIAMTGQGSVGRVGRLQCKNHERPVMNQRVGKFITDEKTLNKDYLHYVISSKFYEEQLFAMGSGSGQPNLSPSMILSLEIPFPPYPEQVAIASTLNSLDDRITLLRETNTTLEAIAQAMFKSWFVDFDPVHAKIQGLAPEGVDEATAALFPDSFEESALGPVPKGWRIGRLDDLLVLQRGFDLPAQDRTPGDFPIIAASGPSGTHHKSMVKGPGVVTGRSGVLGRVFLELEDFWPLNTTLWVKEFKAATPCYAYEVLRLLDFKSFNAGSAVPSLNRNHIHGLPYLLPTRTCVDTFEGIASQIHRRCRVNEKQAQNLVDIRDALLPRLISGQLRISDTPNEIQGV